MRISPRSRSTSTGLALGCALITFATACGSDASGSQVASLDVDSTNDAATTETSTPADTQEASLAFAQCMRDNGVDMEDPTFDADGNAQQGGGFGPDSGIDFGDEATQAAMEACSDLLQNIGPGGGGPGGGNFDATAIQDTFNAFTECLRDEGLEVDDIEFGVGPGGGAIGNRPDGATGTPPGGGSVPDGGFQGGPPGGSIPDVGPGGEGFDPTDRMIQQLELDEDDPAVTAAVEVCQPALENAFTAPTDETEGT